LRVLDNKRQILEPGSAMPTHWLRKKRRRENVRNTQQRTDAVAANDAESSAEIDAANSELFEANRRTQPCDTADVARYRGQRRRQR
jgi:hypothetical protein